MTAPSDVGIEPAEQPPDAQTGSSRSVQPSLGEAVYAARREAYMKTIGSRAVAVIHSPPQSVRNGDVLFPFRQSSDLHYLTGFSEPETTLVLRPGAEKARIVMFVRPRDSKRETWDGRRAGVEGAKERYGADQAYPVAELDKRLPELLANIDELYYSLGLNPAFDQTVAAIIAKLRLSEKKGRRPPRAVVDPRLVLHEMRLRKAPDELTLMGRAVEISIEAHIAAMRQARPGMTEYELEALINFIFRKNGATGPGYSTIVGAGDNGTILHYTENSCTLGENELVLIDAGCEYQSYTADITRTFPASGRFSEAQRRVYEIVLETQKSAIEMTRPGITIDDIHKHCVENLTAGMIALGLLEGSVEERIEDKTYKRFYMHRTSHWLGMDVHDVGAYTNDGTPRPLESGMIITIEPGLYVAADAKNVPAEFRGIGIRIEDDILVTDAGHDNLTAGAPKEISDIETTCASSQFDVL
ncbi:MAG: Xaa-Pro aminopeptidase [Proteobacteria bacterium]|nr:Xaa-Pro aminopeptidase [Pseudomonadota bacterium]